MRDIAGKKRHTRSQAVPSSLIVTATGKGVTTTNLVRQVYENRPHNLRSLEDAEAVFRRNNALNATLPLDGMVLLNPVPLSDAAISQWHRNKYYIDKTFRSNPDLFDFLSKTGPYFQRLANSFVKACEKEKWLIGKLVTTSELVATATSAYAATEEKMLTAIRNSAKELMDDVEAQFGKSIFNKKNMNKLEAILKRSPKYQQLLNQISDLPKWMAKDLGKLSPATIGRRVNAKFLRQQITLPFFNPNGYCDRFARLLCNKVIRFGKIGFHWTWGIPAFISVFDVLASPGKRVQTTAHDAVGILLGAAGTGGGLAAGGTIVVILGLSGTGAFLVMALCAAVGSSIISDLGSKKTDELFKIIGW